MERNYNSIWYDKEGLIALWFTLFKVKGLEEKGLNPALHTPHN
jgi:hypothetical protein